MKIENVTIHNWESPGPLWWKTAESRPDEPIIEATIKMTISYREYRALLDQDRQQDAA